MLGNPKFAVEERAWPKFDGTGPLDTFLAKVDYFLHVSRTPPDDYKLRLI